MAKKTILVACDGSEPSIRAAQFAAVLAESAGCRIELYTVLQMAVFDPEAEFGIPAAKLAAVRAKLAEATFAPVRAVLPDTLEVIETAASGNNVVKTMLDHLDTAPPYMVVMGRTGKSSFQRLLEGSVSRTLNGLATVPVCMVS